MRRLVPIYHLVTRLVATVLATMVGVAAPATAAPVRLTAASKAFVDSQGQRWRPAGSRLAGTRRPAARTPDPIYSTPALYETAAVPPRRARIRVGAPGRYVVTLFLVDPGPRGRAGALEVFSAAGTGSAERFTRRVGVTVPSGTANTVPTHATFEIPLSGDVLDLRFRTLRGDPGVSAIEVQRLGPVTMPPVRTVWSDAFDGAAGSAPDTSLWQVQTGSGWGEGQLQTYSDDPSNLALSGDGRLLITARRDAGVYSSARIQSLATFQLERADVSARIQVPAGRGLWPAFWAAGVQPPVWPYSGELDIMEMLGQQPDQLHGYVHGPTGGTPVRKYENGAILDSITPLSATSHTYEMRSEPGIVVFLMDGVPYGSVARPDIPRGSPWLLDRPYNLLLNVAVGGWPGPPDGSTSFPAQMAVDDVIVQR